jgi:hypothetical protein
MSSLDERTVARGRGLLPERDLAQAAADFYLLETLAAKGDEAGRRMLARLEASLAGEFAAYLEVAVGGELRYAQRHLGEDALPPELACFFREVHPGQRGKAWLVWTVVRRALGGRALELAEVVFSHSGWREHFGGHPWACVARLLRQYLEGEISPRIFVDQCFSLEHNTGSVFNKLYETSRLADVLVAQSRDDYDTLLRFASDGVRWLWRRREWLRRRDHDPIWLGVQLLETFEDRDGEEAPHEP